MAGIVRISVGSLVPRLVIQPNGEATFFALLNQGALNRGRRVFTPVGGAVELTDRGREALTQRFAAFAFEGNDARFRIEETRIDAVLALFRDPESDLFVADPLREVQEELTTAELSIQKRPVLDPGDLDGVTFRHARCIRQKPRDGAAVTSVRLFHLYEMVVPLTVFRKIAASHVIRLLTDGEVATTHGGASEGTTADGQVIGDNMVW